MGWRLCHLCSLLPTGGRAGPAGQGAASDPDICLPWPYAQQIRVHFGLIPGWGGQGLSTTVRFTPERFPSGRPSPKAAAQHHLAELGHWVVLLLHESRRARLWPRPSPLAPPPRGLGRAPCSPRPPAPCQLCLSRSERLRRGPQGWRARPLWRTRAEPCGAEPQGMGAVCAKGRLTLPGPGRPSPASPGRHQWPRHPARLPRPPTLPGPWGPVSREPRVEGVTSRENCFCQTPNNAPLAAVSGRPDTASVGPNVPKNWFRKLGFDGTLFPASNGAKDNPERSLTIFFAG